MSRSRRQGKQFGFWDLAAMGDGLLGDVVRLTGAREAAWCDYQEGEPLPDDLPEDIRSEVGRAVFLKQVTANREAGRLVLPVVQDGFALGALIVEGVAGRGLSDDVRPFLRRLLELGVENLAFRKREVTDPLTGLYNYSRFVDLLGGLIAARWSEGGDGAGRRLSLSGEDDVAPVAVLLMEMSGTAGDDEVLVAEAARRIQEHLAGAGLLARLTGARFGCLIEGADRDRMMALARDLQSQVRGLAVGVLSFPVDCPDLLGGDPQAAGEAADRLLFRVGRALEAALRRGGVFAFGDLLTGDGRVIEVQPGGRVLINLGREFGVEPGMRFLVGAERSAAGHGPTGRYPHDHKAELVVLRADPASSMGEIVFLADPLWPVDKGDELILRTAETAPAEGLPDETDPVTLLPTLRPFSRRLAQLIREGRPAAALLFKLDGLSRTEQVSGRITAQTRCRVLAEKVREAAPEGALIGLYSPDTLAVYAPDLDQARALEFAARVVEAMAATNSLSVGLALYPFFDFSAEDLLPGAVKALDHAALLGPGSVVAFDAVSLNVSGDRLFAAGRIEEAAAEFERALTIDPREVNVQNSLGVCYGHLGRMTEAIEAFGRSIEAAPDNFMAHFNLGFALQHTDPAASAAAFERAVAIDPDHQDARLQLGRLLWTLGRAEDAVVHLEAAVKGPRPRGLVWRLLGEVRRSQGDLEAATAAFKQAVKQSPLDPEALSALGAVFLERGTDAAVALSLCSRAAGLKPGDPFLAVRHGWALWVSGRAAEAEAMLAPLVAAGVPDPLAGWCLAQTRVRQNDLAGARVAVSAALGVDPGHEPSRLLLGEIEARLARNGADAGT